MDTKEIIINCLGERMRNICNQIPKRQFESLEEIRMRVHKPLMAYRNKEEFFITETGGLSNTASYGVLPREEDLVDTVEMMSDYSLYALEEELRNGYITLLGGHRVGLVGRTVVEAGKLKTMRYISGLNIRISHQVLGCADEVIPYVTSGQAVLHTLVVSPPRCGKTTLLRDMIRQLSNGIPGRLGGITVGVVDERSEIAGCYHGIPQNNVGMRTDVLDCCPKAEGMMMLIRSMSPKIIAVDEIGKPEDIYAIEDAMHAGIKLICTVHGSSIEDIKRKPVLSVLLQKQIFERIIILSQSNGPGTIEAIFDGQKLEFVAGRRE